MNQLRLSRVVFAHPVLPPGAGSDGRRVTELRAPEYELGIPHGQPWLIAVRDGACEVYGPDSVAQATVDMEAAVAAK